MNPDLYTDEFRNFKYLKSHPVSVKYYKERARQINSVQPWAQINDPAFTWTSRIEFLEQLLDLHQHTVYLVYPGPMTESGGAFTSHSGYESSVLYEIVNPTIYEGNVLQPGLGELITYNDISHVEDISGDGWCLCSQEYHKDPTVSLEVGPVFKLDKSFLFTALNYSAIFYNKDVAEKYRDALTQFLRKNSDAVSAISRLF
jgi:hypothetical protein